ncbi:peptidoglycan-binding domain-containing protein [Bacillus sp. SPARC3]|nr:peptidoglycan-binding protein [Bacillus sp. SPARC3]
MRTNVDAVKLFQSLHRLNSDGIYGPKTNESKT